MTIPTDVKITLRDAADLIDTAHLGVDGTLEYEGRFHGERRRQRGETRPGRPDVLAALEKVKQRIDPLHVKIWAHINQDKPFTADPIIDTVRAAAFELYTIVRTYPNAYPSAAKAANELRQAANLLRSVPKVWKKP